MKSSKSKIISIHSTGPAWMRIDEAHQNDKVRPIVPLVRCCVCNNARPTHRCRSYHRDEWICDTCTSASDRALPPPPKKDDGPSTMTEPHTCVQCGELSTDGQDMKQDTDPTMALCWDPKQGEKKDGWWCDVCVQRLTTCRVPGCNQKLTTPLAKEIPWICKDCLVAHCSLCGCRETTCESCHGTCSRVAFSKEYIVWVIKEDDDACMSHLPSLAPSVTRSTPTGQDALLLPESVEGFLRQYSETKSARVASASSSAPQRRWHTWETVRLVSTYADRMSTQHPLEHATDTSKWIDSVQQLTTFTLSFVLQDQGPSVPPWIRCLQCSLICRYCVHLFIESRIRTCLSSTCRRTYCDRCAPFFIRLSPVVDCIWCTTSRDTFAPASRLAYTSRFQIKK